MIYEQEDPLQQEVVLALDGVEDQLTHARVLEHDLGNERAGDDHAQLKGEAGDLRQPWRSGTRNCGSTPAAPQRLKVRL